MAVDWSEHRFSGGALALDVANTVVLRIDPARRFDRFDDAHEIERFAAAATVFRADELGEVALTVARPEIVKARVVRLREATDKLFREASEIGQLDADKVAELLGACSEAMQGAGKFTCEGKASAARLTLESAVAMSALNLLQPERLSRMRICANCGWLFVDRSRNGSRIWCDMAVCGNRRKAARHYNRLKKTEVIYDSAAD
ncbi:MAG: CGNR zinc finger domain-containing protein [Mesorhizobium sp.]